MNERTKAILLAANQGKYCSPAEMRKKKKKGKKPEMNQKTFGDPALGIVRNPDGVFVSNEGHYGHMMGAKRNHAKCLECIKAGDHQGATDAADRVSVYADKLNTPEAMALADEAHESCAKCRKEGSAMHKYHTGKKTPKKGVGMAKKGTVEPAQNAFRSTDHPRHPAGSAKGGEFAPGDAVSVGAGFHKFKGMVVKEHGDPKRDTVKVKNPDGKEFWYGKKAVTKITPKASKSGKKSLRHRFAAPDPVLTPAKSAKAEAASKFAYEGDRDMGGSGGAHQYRHRDAWMAQEMAAKRYPTKSPQYKYHMKRAGAHSGIFNG
jgi:hypothetical protein